MELPTDFLSLGRGSVTRHVIRDCKKLQNQNQRFMFVHISSSIEASNQLVQFSADELPRFYLY